MESRWPQRLRFATSISLCSGWQEGARRNRRAQPPTRPHFGAIVERGIAADNPTGTGSTGTAPASATRRDRLSQARHQAARNADRPDPAAKRLGDALRCSRHRQDNGGARLGLCRGDRNRLPEMASAEATARLAGRRRNACGGGGESVSAEVVLNLIERGQDADDSGKNTADPYEPPWDSGRRPPLVLPASHSPTMAGFLSACYKNVHQRRCGRE